MEICAYHAHPIPALRARAIQIQNKRDYLEDVYIVRRHLAHGLGDLLVGLFDGHGGRCVLKRLCKRLPRQTAPDAR